MYYPKPSLNSELVFVKYTESGTSAESAAFPNSEILTLEENVFVNRNGKMPWTMEIKNILSDHSANLQVLRRC